MREYRQERDQAARELAAAEQKTVSRLRGLAWKKGAVTFTPYGYINASVVYESSKTTTGDFCIYSLSPDVNDDSGMFFDPRSSRIGLRMDGPGPRGWRGSQIRGAIEVDFQGAYSVRNRSALMLRKAYVEVFDKELRLLAGQDWEIISPLYPNTLNYTAGAAVGNPGYRRAQLRVDRRFQCGSGNNLLFQFGIFDNVLRDALNVGGIEASGGDWPILEGRIGYSFGEKCFAHGKPITLGISGHVGQQQYKYADNSGLARHDHDTWSFNIDADIPLSKALRLQGELFLGENLSSFEAGVMQGIDLIRRDTVRSQGGWIGLEYALTPQWQFNLCYMIDDPFDEDLIWGSGGDGLSRTYNHCLFVNALFNWTEALMFGFEVSFWRTHWQWADASTQTVNTLRPGEAIRYEFVTRYTF